MNLINRILADLPPNDLKPFRSRIKALDFSLYTTSQLNEDDIKRRLDLTARLVTKNLSLSDILRIAQSHKKYLAGKPKLRVNAYQVFLKDFHNRNSHLTFSERCKTAPEEYKSLSDAQKKPFLDKANVVNCKSSINSTEPPEKK